MEHVVAVTIQYGGQTTRYSPAFQTKPEFARPWKKVLQEAYGKAIVHCCCSGIGAKQLSIRHYDDSDTYGLARFPLSGWEHAKECRFYSPNSIKSGCSSYEKGVLEERADGTMKIRLGIGLTKRDALPATAKPELPLPSAGISRTQPAMKLLGLLHLLWTETDLNVWWPAMQGKRNVNRIHWWLNGAAEHITAGKHNLSRVLLLATSAEGSPDEKRNADKVREAIKTKSRMLVIAPLATHSPERESMIVSKLPIAGFYGIPPMFMTEAIWFSVERRFPSAVAAWRQGHKVIAIAQIDPKAGTKCSVANVVDVALMAVTDQWIPVESSYERVIADKLTAEGRAFIKPLRFEASEDVVFPDFILRDTPKEAPLEVFGRNDEAYEARKAEKIGYYREHFGVDGWWSWNAAMDPSGSNILPFPPAKGHDTLTSRAPISVGSIAHE